MKSQLKLSESFLQVGYLQGFTYIDRAGSLINLYQKKDGSVAYSMSPNQLVIPNPSSGLDELKIANTDTWAHSLHPESLNSVADDFKSEVKRVLSILGVQKLSSLGWRNYWALDRESDPDLKALGAIPDYKLRELRLEIELPSPFSAVITIKSVKQAAETDDIEKFAVLFDLDVFYRDDFELDRLGQKIEQIRGHINGPKVQGFFDKAVEALS